MRQPRLGFNLLLLGMAYGVPLFGQSGGSFVQAGNMMSSRVGHTATRLRDGRVLIAGGGPAMAEIFDPVTGAFTWTGHMGVVRYGHTATLLMDGRVLVTGGELQQSCRWPIDCWLSTAIVYDPITGQFTPTGSMSAQRRYHTATLLSTGKVLIAGGPSETEIYDPDSGTFTVVHGVPDTSQVTNAFRLYSGKVLFVGGVVTVYDPASGNAGSWHSYHGFGHATALLANGQVLITGGGERPAVLSLDNYQYAHVDRFDPVNMIFVETGWLTTPRVYHTATALLDGRALVAGGHNWNGSLSSTEVYDAETGKFTDGPGMTSSRESATATLLRDGRVLITGGWTRTPWPNTTAVRLGTTELFVPDTRPDSGCTYEIAPSSLQVGNTGATIPIAIETDPACSWTVNDFEAWVMVPGANYGTGAATLNLVIAANSGPDRTTTVLVAGKIGLEIIQSSALSARAMKESGRTFSAGECAGSAQVAIQSGCGWRAVRSMPWSAIRDGVISTSDGTLTCHAEPNLDPTRVDGEDAVSACRPLYTPNG